MEVARSGARVTFHEQVKVIRFSDGDGEDSFGSEDGNFGSESSLSADRISLSQSTSSSHSMKTTGSDSPDEISTTNLRTEESKEWRKMPNAMLSDETKERLKRQKAFVKDRPLSAKLTKENFDENALKLLQAHDTNEVKKLAKEIAEDLLSLPEHEIEYILAVKRLPYYLHLVGPKTLAEFRDSFKEACKAKNKANMEFHSIFLTVKSIHSSKENHEEIGSHAKRLENLFRIQPSSNKKKITKALKRIAENLPLGLTIDEREITFWRLQDAAKRYFTGEELEEAMQYIETERKRDYEYLPLRKNRRVIEEEK